ncbi:perforin-1 isoform X2 [Carassius gibelio]|uniref:perforin-1 isoform X2 n=1 Tax=Carassius gibelio TaxID=101364 RepID=UPI0022780854|nr:perforin-1 isoform X2 [Carassius gibelio]
MAVFYHLRLVSLTVLMLVSLLDFSSAAVVVSGLRGYNLPGDNLGNAPDPYVKIFCGGEYKKTNYFQGKRDPEWTSSYSFSGCKSGHTLELQVWDQDVKFDDLLGSSSITVRPGTNSGSFSVGKGKMNFRYSVK